MAVVKQISESTFKNDTLDVNQKYQEVGAFLRSVRQTNKITLAKISDTLKVKQKYLSLIEEGKYQEVNKSVYYIGCVMAMMKLLKVQNSEELIDLLIKDNPDFSAHSVNLQASPTKKEETENQSVNIVWHFKNIQNIATKKRLALMFIILSLLFVLTKILMPSEENSEIHDSNSFEVTLR